MKREYSKPEIKADAYAEFENVLTWACSKQYKEAVCEGNDAWTVPQPKIPNGLPPDHYTGQSDFPCAHGEGPHNIGS